MRFRDIFWVFTPRARTRCSVILLWAKIFNFLSKGTTPMKRKAVSIILALCLLLTLAPMAMADEGSANEISTFEQLQQAFENGGTYTLTKDITVESGLILKSSTPALTIDGANHTIAPAVTGLNEQGSVNDGATKIDNLIINSGTLTLKNLNVYGGKGRAIDNKGTLVMETVSIERASGTGYGAGLYNERNSSKALLTDCNIRNNTTTSAGGGFFNNGMLIMERSAVVENTNTSGNSNGGGGGENGGQLYLNNCTVANNQSSEIGGGLNLYGGRAYIMNTTVTGNITTQSTSFGGGIGCHGGAKVYAVNSVFSYNYSKEPRELSDISFGGSNNEYFYNCAYTSTVGTLQDGNKANLKELTGTIDTVYKNNGALQKLANGTYGIYPTDASPLQTGGTTTYFEYDGNSTVKMAFVNGNETAPLGALNAATSKVTKYQDNTVRANGVIGALSDKAGTITTYTVTVETAEHGTVAVNGGSDLVKSYDENTEVTLKAVPDENYKFVKWIVKTDNDNSDEQANPYTFNVTQDVTITPVFASTEQKPSSSGTIVDPAYDVLVGTASNGLLLSDYAMAKAGTVVTITAKAASGYEVQAVTVTDKDNKAVTVTAKDGKYTFTMPKSSVNVSASFVKLEDKKDDTAKDNQGTSKLTIIMQIGNTDILVNGRHLANDVAPVIVSNRTLVPIRVVTETLGGTAEWDAKDKTVTLNIDGKTIEMTVGVTLEKYGVAPVIMNDRTYVPIRFVAEELGATVDWTAETQTITITK